MAGIEFGGSVEEGVVGHSLKIPLIFRLKYLSNYDINTYG